MRFHLDNLKVKDYSSVNNALVIFVISLFLNSSKTLEDKSVSFFYPPNSLEKGTIYAVNIELKIIVNRHDGADPVSSVRRLFDRLF